MKKDSVDVFADKAARIPLLTLEEEIHLGRSVQKMMGVIESNPDGPYSKAERVILHRGKRAKERFVNANLRLVVSVARKYERVMSNTLDLNTEDLLQEGMFGLIRAVEKFDPERGYKFSTYAYWWIRQSIVRALHITGRTIRLPVNVAEKMYGLNRKRDALTEKLKRPPTIAELAKEMDWEPMFLEQVLLMGGRLTSLDKGLTEDGMTLGDLISDGRGGDDHLDDVGSEIRREKVREVMCHLTENEQIAVRMRYGFDGHETTLREVGEQLGVTRERARQVLDRATNKLRRMLYEQDLRLAA